jgi:hypothetical protein
MGIGQYSAGMILRSTIMVAAHIVCSTCKSLNFGTFSKTKSLNSNLANFQKYSLTVLAS